MQIYKSPIAIVPMRFSPMQKRMNFMSVIDCRSEATVQPPVGALLLRRVHFQKGPWLLRLAVPEFPLLRGRVVRRKQSQTGCSPHGRALPKRVKIKLFNFESDLENGTLFFSLYIQVTDSL